MDTAQNTQIRSDSHINYTDCAKRAPSKTGVACSGTTPQIGNVASLVNISNGSRYTLVTRNLVGRSRGASLWLDRPYMSNEHASISWNGNAWELKDLGSRNGSYIDGRRMEAGESVAVNEESIIGFGDPQEKWSLVDSGAPVLSALNQESGESYVAENGLLSIPQEGPPEISVYQNKTGQWIAETSAGDISEIEDSSVLTAGKNSYRISLPYIDEGTPLLGLPSLDLMKLRFEVPKNLEHVRITLVHAGGEFELESREHSFLLLILAKERLAEEGDVTPETGWVDRDELARMVGVTVPVLHVLVHRARQQFADQNIPGAADIVDVRRGQRRLGAHNIEIIEY